MRFSLRFETVNVSRHVIKHNNVHRFTSTHLQPAICTNQFAICYIYRIDDVHASCAVVSIADVVVKFLQLSVLLVTVFANEGNVLFIIYAPPHGRVQIVKCGGFVGHLIYYGTINRLETFYKYKDTVRRRVDNKKRTVTVPGIPQIVNVSVNGG